MTIDEILQNIQQYDCKLVEVTGGEPLLQKESIKLMKILLKDNYKVMLETGGSLPITQVPKEVIKVVDFKCPSSKMEKKNLWKNINYVKNNDQIKFVIGDRKDYEWTKKKILELDLNSKCEILLSPVYNQIEPKEIVDWILEDNLNVRFQLQLHKEIWPESERGV